MLSIQCNYIFLSIQQLNMCMQIEDKYIPKFQKKEKNLQKTSRGQLLENDHQLLLKFYRQLFKIANLSQFIQNSLQMNSSKDYKSVQDTQNQTPQSSNIFMKNEKPPIYLSMLQKITEDKNIAISTSLQNIQTKIMQKSDIELLEQENKNLKQQNKELKKQLSQFKGQNDIWTADSSRHQVCQAKSLSFNPKQNEKKEVDQINQLNNWVETLKKQCRMYEGIIDKMDQKITTLESINISLKQQVKKLETQKQKIEKTHSTQKIELIQRNIMKQNENKMLVKQFKERINRIMDKYGQLQSYANNSEIQWTIWKEKWNCQKRSYLTKIIELEKSIRELKESNRNTTRNWQKDQNNSASKQFQYDRNRNNQWVTESIRPRNQTSASFKSREKQRRKY